MMKRSLDLIASSIGLIFLFPVFLVIGVVITCTSKGGPFFVQQRVGRSGVHFKLFKFKTMRPPQDLPQNNFDLGDSNRVTLIGRILRTTKLDELPQLLNVLRGDMSLVGPRPEVPEWTEEYPDQWETVLSVRPGLTDPASIAFRNEEELLAESADPKATYRNVILPKKLELSSRYVRERTFVDDLRIIAQTFWIMAMPSRGGD